MTTAPEKPQPVDLAREPAFALGRLEIRPATREVIAGETRELLEPKVMQVLTVLYRGRGEVVSRDELIARCWGGRAIGDDAINRCVARLRRLSEAHGGFLLETVPRVGHRLLITGAAESAPPSPPPPPPAPPPPPPPLVIFARPKSWRWLALGALVLLAAGIILPLFLRPQAEQVRVTPPPRLSIAVLPFTPLNGDPEMANLGDAIASAVTDQLSNGTRFVIVSPAQSFAFRGPGKAKAAKALHADFLIDGDVRRTPGWVTASVRLIDGRSGAVLRTQTNSRTEEEAAKLPEHVAISVANFGWVAAFGFGPNAHWNQHAMAVHLQVVGMVVRGDLLAAYEVSRRLASELPDDAFAVHEPSVAIAYLLGSNIPAKRPELIAQSRYYAERAIGLDPTYGEPYIQLQATDPDITLQQREVLLQKALALSPETIYGRSALVEFLHNTGRFRDAEPVADFGIARAPYHEGLYMKVINSRVWTGRADEAQNLIRRGIELFPRRGGYFAKMFETAAFNGDLAGAEKLLQNPVLRHVYDPDAPPSIYQTVLDVLSHRRPASDIVSACDPAGLRTYELRQTCLVALVKVGEVDAAFRVAAVIYPDLHAAPPAARTAKWVAAPYFPTSYLLIPATAALRADPRFGALAERLGLTAYWKESGTVPDFCNSEKVAVCAGLVSRR